MYYNRIVLIGRLTRDPELRATPDGMSVARFTLAVDRGTRAGEERVTDFFDIVAFRQLADTVANYMTKGKLVLVEGRLQTRKYTDREGNPRKAYEILADAVRFLERREVETETPPTEAEYTPAAAPRTYERTTPAPAAVETTPENDYDIELDTGEFDDVVDDPFR
ncbi:MAG: single-stranded DNA-binding protein [Fimbriimonadales bacterium]|nr:single-stranded DNA-binding protein [Fimbriimonadales bacterium]